MSDNKITLDLTPIVEGIKTVADSMLAVAETITEIMQPRPWREVSELRDLCHDHDLDRVERGPATVRRDNGSLVAEWDGEQLTKYKANE